MSGLVHEPGMMGEALRLWEHGFHVIPLGSPLEQPSEWLIRQCDSLEDATNKWPKRPRIKWTEFQHSQPSEAEITEWWTAAPKANIGIITGLQVNIVDADSSEAAEWVEGNLTRTPWKVKTGKGVQYYYRVDGLDVRNAANPHSKLDIRGRGGYVVAPPSVHANGNSYTWVKDDAYGADSWSDLPALTREDLLKISGHEAELSSGTAVRDVHVLRIDTQHVKLPASGDPVLPGGRNDAAASLVGQKITHRLALDEIRLQLYRWNQSNPVPLSNEELETTILSVIRTHFSRNPVGQLSVEQGAANDVLFSLEDARIDHMLDSPPPEMNWHIKDFLPTAKVGMLTAPGGMGKGYFSLQLCVSLACGHPFLGRLPVSKPVKCLVLAAEDDRDDLHRRLNNIVEELCLRDEQKKLLRENLLLHSVVKGSCLLTESRGGEVRRTRFLDALVATLELFPQIECLVLDPTSRFRGGEENKAEDNTRYVEALELISARIGTAIIVTHHANKNSMREGGAEEAYAARGSSALTDGVRLQMNLSYADKKELNKRGIPEDQQRHYLHLSVPKSNYTKPFAPRYLYRDPNSGVLSIVDLPSGKQAREAADFERVAPLVLQSLQRNPDEYTARQFCSRFGGVDRGDLKVNEKKLRDIIDRMIEQGYIREREGKASNGHTVLMLSVAEPWGPANSEMESSPRSKMAAGSEKRSNLSL